MSAKPIPPSEWGKGVLKPLPAFTPVDHDARVAELLGRGYRIEIQSDAYTQLVTGKPVNHPLHFFIGLVTFGLWWLVWLLLAITGGERRAVIPRPAAPTAGSPR
jgi:hypothetical protein